MPLNQQDPLRRDLTRRVKRRKRRHQLSHARIEANFPAGFDAFNPANSPFSALTFLANAANGPLPCNAFAPEDLDFAEIHAGQVVERDQFLVAPPR